MSYTLTIETEFNYTAYLYSDAKTSTIEVKSFETKKEAQKELRRMIKVEGYTLSNGYYYNSELRTELFKNY